MLLELMKLQDEAVWAIRNLVRPAEKTRTVRNDMEYFFQLYEIERHAIHVSETLKVGIDTVESMLNDHDHFNHSHPNSSDIAKGSHSNTGMTLAFTKNMLRALLERSASNKDRLTNEIQLSFNALVSADSRETIKIGHSTRIDSAAMKTVAFVTTAFLPATFISAVFSMSFFDFNSDEGKWLVSQKFWIYWVVTIPVTVISVSMWFFFIPVNPDPWNPANGEKKDPERIIHRNTSFARQGLKKATTFFSRDKSDIV